MTLLGVGELSHTNPAGIVCELGALPKDIDTEGGGTIGFKSGGDKAFRGDSFLGGCVVELAPKSGVGGIESGFDGKGSLGRSRDEAFQGEWISVEFWGVFLTEV
jgi:hypothetical protein